jgi:hypothetical protein
MEFPSKFNYGTELMPKILKAIISHNPNKLADNIDKISILEPQEKLKLLITNTLVGDIYYINKDSSRETPG